MWHWVSISLCRGSWSRLDSLGSGSNRPVQARYLADIKICLTVSPNYAFEAPQDRSHIHSPVAAFTLSLPALGHRYVFFSWSFWVSELGGVSLSAWVSLAAFAKRLCELLHPLANRFACTIRFLINLRFILETLLGMLRREGLQSYGWIPYHCLMDFFDGLVHLRGNFTAT